MKDILYYYEMNATTWVYLSSLIIIAVYFKFRRFWSVRNLDLIGLIAFAPGLLMVAYGRGALDVPPPRAAAAEMRARTPEAEPGLRPSPAAEETSLSKAKQTEQFGYLWLFAVSGFFVFRMLVDPAMVRRPLLEPNLSASGLTFACASMLVFLMSNVITNHPQIAEAPTAAVADRAADWPTGDRPAAERPERDSAAGGSEKEKLEEVVKMRGPGYPAFQVFSQGSDGYTRRITAILAHLSIVIGLVLIGYRHFDNTHAGIAAATLYLLLPYTAEFTPRVDHVVPGALLVWAIQGYRRPVVAGIFIGLAAGLTWYPLFLLPLWFSFYWRRGLLRFSFSVIVVLGLVIASLALMPASMGSFWHQLLQTVGAWYVEKSYLHGFWDKASAPFRWPVMAVFFAMCGSMVLWPAQKNLGSLLACSSAIMLGTQFWKAYDGGLYMAWFLPLLVLTILRPNLEDRVALSAISEGWVKWRK